MDAGAAIFIAIFLVLGLLGAPGIAFVLLFAGMLLVGVLMAIAGMGKEKPNGRNS